MSIRRAAAVPGQARTRFTLLSLMRGSEGRRLAVVLAAVLALAGFLGGINPGAAAGAAGDGFTLCRSGGGTENGAPLAPRTQHHLDCCLTGHAPIHDGPPGALAELQAEFGSTIASPLVQASGPVTILLALASEGPRGPPLAG